MDELDTQLAEDLAAQKEAQIPEQAEPEDGELSQQKAEEEKLEEAKKFDEAYVKGLRAENAKYRRALREEQQRNRAYPQQNYGNANQYQQNGYPQAGNPQQQQPIYDPRVDDMILANKLGEIKADPYFGELFSETDDEGITFEEKLLERAAETSWPISELDALVFKMEKEKLIGKVRQKAIDETYKNISSKAANSAERNVSSGKNTDDGEVGSIDDAVKKAMKEHGVTSLSELR